jgi:hypothetical protein
MVALSVAVKPAGPTMAACIEMQSFHMRKTLLDACATSGVQQSFEAANIFACWLQSILFDALHQPYFFRCNILLVGCLKIFTSTHLLTRHTTGGDSRHVRRRPGTLHVTCTCTRMMGLLLLQMQVSSVSPAYCS